MTAGDYGSWSGQSDLLKSIDRIIGTIAEPFADISILLTLLVSELAAASVKVVLLGDGGGITKWPLRCVRANRPPAALFERPKQGFGAPISAWLRGDLRAQPEDM